MRPWQTFGAKVFVDPERALIHSLSGSPRQRLASDWGAFGEMTEHLPLAHHTAWPNCSHSSSHTHALFLQLSSLPHQLRSLVTGLSGSCQPNCRGQPFLNGTTISWIPCRRLLFGGWIHLAGSLEHRHWSARMLLHTTLQIRGEYENDCW